ncbi:MAG: hypothetical protein LQ340_004137 [Diploschistes diacapsis]|nr:MAG: hypothetical protein LQ340_004137 [Diploschistes diacapsis]
MSRTSHITTITIPSGSNWTSEPHRHKSHTEYLSVKDGTALVTLGSQTQSWTASDGLITIERGVVHEWRRDPNDDGVLVVEEWTDPADGQKELFFRNLLSTMLDMTDLPSPAPAPTWMPFDWWLTLQLFPISHEFDNSPLLYSGLAGRPATYYILFVADLIGLMFGLRGKYKEYTPGGLYLKGKDN